MDGVGTLDGVGMDIMVVGTILGDGIMAGMDFTEVIMVDGMVVHMPIIILTFTMVMVADIQDITHITVEEEVTIIDHL